MKGIYRLNQLARGVRRVHLRAVANDRYAALRGLDGENPGPWLGDEPSSIVDEISGARFRYLASLEEENEHLRDLLNGVAFALGFDVDEVHYCSEDDYGQCQRAVLARIRELTGAADEPAEGEERE